MRYGRLSPNNVPNLECLPHFIEAGLGLVADLGMSETRLYGDMCSGESRWMDSGICKFLGIREGIVSTLSNMTGMWPEFAIYYTKYL